jgi:putative sterol carrier protein
VKTKKLFVIAVFTVSIALMILNLRNLVNNLWEKQALAMEVRSNEKAQKDKINRKWMERVLQAFVEYALNDKSLKSYARGKDVTMQFTLSDIDLQFYLRFRHGTVSGELAAPPELAEVHLEMEALVFDKIFTQQLNAGYAAVTGDLSFEGDMWKALALERINDDLFRLYAWSIEKEGTSDKFVSVSPADSY